MHPTPRPLQPSIEPPTAVERDQRVVPRWLRVVLDDARARGRDVRVWRRVTAFGSYLLSAEVA